MNTMKDLFGSWDYTILATLAAFAAIILAYQVIKGTIERGITRNRRG